MWLLHVIVIAGTSGWQTGIGLWLLASLLGGGFAVLSGEWRTGDALLLDLMLAGAGVLAGNAITSPLGPDPLADVYGVRFACATAGAAVLLVASHDVVYRLLTRQSASFRGLPLSGTGSFQFLYTWTSGWPSEAAPIEASYSDGLQLKLLEDALHYQLRRGPLTGSETVPVEPGTQLQAQDGGALLICFAGSRHGDHEPRTLKLEGVTPAGANVAIADRFNALVAAWEGAAIGPE